jgi:hypothetical protein
VKVIGENASEDLGSRAKEVERKEGGDALVCPARDNLRFEK